MDPYNNPGDHLNSRGQPAPLRDSTAGEPGHDTADNPAGGAPGGGQPPAADRRPQYSGGFTVIPPNESRRSKMKMMAQKEEENLKTWKEANRVTSVHTNPERLGGNVSLAEAREKQLTNLRCSKLQKKMRKEEQDKMRRQQEEEDLQKMKAERRAMAERQEERKRQDEQRRREEYRQDHLRRTEHFLQRFERRAPGPSASGRAPHASSRSEVEAEAEASKQREERSVRDVQLDHRRVNSDFLDKLEGRGQGSGQETKGEGTRETEYPCLASEDSGHQPPVTYGQQPPLAHLDRGAEQSCPGWTEGADPEPDYDWALMKLINSFPDCARVFLEDILDQCGGDFEQAYTLLICTLS